MTSALILLARVLERIANAQEQNAATQERIQIALENLTEILLRKTS